ncbi:unnamed protein product, partial [marine sediment metagenome]
MTEKTEKEPEEIKVPEKFKKLIDEIEKMSVLDLAELVKVLEKKFGVSAAVPVAAVPGAPAAPAAEEAPEKTVFNIELKEVGDKKIEVIKVVRDATQKGLKEAKDLVDAAATGSQVVKENVKKEEAENFFDKSKQIKVLIKSKNLVLIICLIFFLLLGFFVFQKEKEKELKEYQSVLNNVQAKVFQAENFLIFKNVEEAQTLFEEAWEELLPLAKI